MTEKIKPQTIIEELEIEISSVLDSAKQGQELECPMQLRLTMNQVRRKMARVLLIINQMEIDE